MGNNYTATIERNDLPQPTILTWKELHAINFAFDSPFILELIDGQVFSADQIVRILPKKRLVAFGTWKDKPVVAKLFFDPHRAQEHMERELAGVKTMRDNKIPTPPLYFRGISKDRRIHILIFRRIFEATNLEDIWQNKESVEALMPKLQNMIIELATQHVLGVMQHDLHLKNFLIAKKIIFTLDGAEIELMPHLLPKKQSMENLALFLSQFGVGVEEYQEKLFRHYAKSRGWLLKSEDINELFLSIKKWNDTRWKQYEKKIFRECSNFVCIRDWRTFGVYDRSYAHPEFLNFLKNPDLVFQHPDAKILKAGRSSTVIKIKLDKRDFVIKRYNIKNFWHQVRRSLRATRAAVSWRLAQKLHLFGIKTAKPVAFIETRFLGLRSKSYYVTEYVSGEHAGEFISRHDGQDEKIMSIVRHITTLLKDTAKVEITHGDLKITNILINTQEQPVLIDLDGASEHLSLSSLRGAWRKEIKRFLENFDEQPAIKEKFKEQLS